MAYVDSRSSTTKSASSVEMFSFTFNPELMNLFWGLYKGKTENSSSVASIEDGSQLESGAIPFFIEPLAQSSTAVPNNVQGSQYFIFGYQLPIDSEASLTKNVLNVLRHSVITTGIVILVGLGSYCTYCTLQKLRRLISKDSSTTSSCSAPASLPWWPLKFQPNANKYKNIPKSASYSSSSTQKTDSGNYSNDLEAIKLGLTLNLKNGKSEERINGNGTDGEKTVKEMYDGKKRRKGGHRRHEGEHFSPSPVLSHINRGHAFTGHKNVNTEGRVLVGAGEEYTFRGDDEEFQIEYFGPASASSSPTLSDRSDNEDDVYPDPYKNRYMTGGTILPGTTIQTMISPSHSQSGTVRRQLDFGNVSPIPSAASQPPYLQHHHLPPLSASSSMSLSPSTPTTGEFTSTIVTSSTPQPPRA